MAAFLKIRYIANGLLKNRIISADGIDVIEPFSSPGGRYVDETRSRIFMKDGTKYDMSVSIDDILNILRDAGSPVAEIQSARPEKHKQVNALPAGSVSLYTRSPLVKQAEGPRKSADVALLKHAEPPRKLA